MSKWNKRFAVDLGERVGATFLGALLTVITLEQTVNLSATSLWTVLGVPTAVALIKGLLANMANGESGASLAPAPPGPEVNPDRTYYDGLGNRIG